MTCIAVKKETDGIHLCCDTEISRGSLRDKSSKSMKDTMQNYCKMYQENEISFGLAGRLEDTLRFRQYIKTHLPKGERLDDIEDFIMDFYKYVKDIVSDFKPRSSMIMVYKGKMYAIEEYMIREISEYFAVGSGFSYARTAMYLGKTAREAVDCAKELAGGVGGETIEFIIK